MIPVFPFASPIHRRVTTRRSTVWLLAITACLAASAAAAADDKKADRDARRIQALEQRFESERSQWQTERADLQKKLSDSEALVEKSKTELEATATSLAHTQGEAARLRKSVADLTAKLASQKDASDKELAARQTMLEKFTAARQQERLAVNARYEAQSSALSACSDDNHRLLGLGHELLMRYRNKGLMDALGQEEPFLGLGDVEMFNRVQDYQERIDKERFDPASPAKTSP